MLVQLESLKRAKSMKYYAYIEKGQRAQLIKLGGGKSWPTLDCAVTWCKLSADSVCCV